jgi:adenylylsulfate kinase
VIIQMTGLSGSGKSTISSEVSQRLKKRDILVEVIDGDEYRQGICADLGFSKEDRNKNIRRLGFVAKVLSRNGVVVIIAAINPYENIRDEIRQMSDQTKTVFVKCGIRTLRDRDPKGLYRKALLPEDHPERINNFTGISDPFDTPLVCDLTLNTDTETVEQSVAKLENFILKNVRNK